eukprot:COSAG04_NODE_708_length_10915_cov_5.000555_6_plen_949_part_00
MPTMRPWLLAAAAYLALAGFLAETRLELADLQRQGGAAERRGLSESDGRWSRAMEELVEAGLGKLRAEGAAAEERLEKQIDAKVGRVNEKVDELRLDLDELRPRRKRRRRRRAQNAQTCADAQTFRGRTDAAMDACCPAGGGGGKGHRRLQADCELPDTCPSAECAATFTSFVDDCTDMLGAEELARLRGFYTNCQELDSNAQLMLGDAEQAMIFHVLVFDDAAAQAQSMFGGGGSSSTSNPGNPPLDSLHPLAPPPALPGPSPPGVSGAVALEEFQAVCTKANLATCAPACNAETHGFLLNIQIDGRGTVMTCTMYNGMYSWQGQASLGGYIGLNSEAFFSSVVSGAAGTYMCTLGEDAGISTDLNVERGQILSVSGSAGATKWGSGGFDLSDGASLTLSNMVVAGEVTVAAGAALTLDTVVMQAGACVGTAGSAQVNLLNTAAPEQCLINVQWDGSDPAAFLSNLGSGRSGTYVLRVTSDPLTITAVSVGPQQEVRFISAGGGSSVTFSEELTVAAGASFSVSGGIDTITFQGALSVAQGASASVSVTASAVTLERAVELGDDSSLSIAGTIGNLAFPAGLRTGTDATVSISSSSPSSIAVAMGTTWYAVDPSSNHGSVTFGRVGLLGTSGETLIGTADGTLPGSLSVQLNGQQPGGGGPQIGAVLLGVDGTITIPPAVSAAVGQVFTGGHLAEFVSSVNAGTPGMYGLQLESGGSDPWSAAGPDFEIDSLSLSSGQDVRIFSDAHSTLTFVGATSIARMSSLTISGEIWMQSGNIIAIAASSVSNAGVVSFRGSRTMLFEEGKVWRLTGSLPGNITMCADDVCRSPGSCPMMDSDSVIIQYNNDARTYRSVATYVCENTYETPMPGGAYRSGSTLGGIAERYCQIDGTWSGPETTFCGNCCSGCDDRCNNRRGSYAGSGSSTDYNCRANNGPPPGANCGMCYPTC